MARLIFTHCIPNCHYDDIINNVQDDVEKMVDSIVQSPDLSYRVVSTIGDTLGQIHAKIEMTGDVVVLSKIVQHGIIPRKQPFSFESLERDYV